VTDRGGTREVPLEEALQQRTYQDAVVAGKRMAIREVLKKREAWLAKHEPKAPEPKPILISPDPDNADAALVLLGIAVPNPARKDFPADRAQLLLEPWAVQAALRRRRTSRPGSWTARAIKGSTGPQPSALTRSNGLIRRNIIEHQSCRSEGGTTARGTPEVSTWPITWSTPDPRQGQPGRTNGNAVSNPRIRV
jgi:hypothetical protein